MARRAQAMQAQTLARETLAIVIVIVNEMVDKSTGDTNE